MSEFGTITYEGNSYELTDNCFLTNRLFDGWWGDAEEGEEYTSEWEAPARDETGNIYRVTWQFEAIKGEEPEDDGWPWENDEHIINVEMIEEAED